MFITVNIPWNILEDISMSKQLKEIKENLKSMRDALNLDDVDGFLDVTENFIDNGYFKWLIEQAEQTQYWKGIAIWQNNEKLEMEKITLKNEQQNKRYRLILSYVKEIDCIDWNKKELAEMARQALESETE